MDHYRSTTEDLLQVFEVLGRYSEESNHDIKNLFRERKNQKNIILVVDEAHLYLGARESLTKASILNKLKTIFTQCRKRKIRIIFITQRLTQIDIYVRRLSDYVEEYNYKSLIFVEWVRRKVYLNKWDVADIETDNSIKITNDWETQTIKQDSQIDSGFFRPLTTLLQLFSYLDKNHQRMIKEEYKTLHICWYEDKAVKPFLYSEFLEQIKVAKNTTQKKIPKLLTLWEKIKTRYQKRELKLDAEYYREEILEDYKARKEKVVELQPILEKKQDAITNTLSKLKLEENGSNGGKPNATNQWEIRPIMSSIVRGSVNNETLDRSGRDNNCPKFYTPTSMSRSV